MFSGVNVLIIGPRDDELRRIEEMAMGMNFRVRITDGISDALNCSEDTDILISVERVPTGPTTPVIQKFMQSCDGPVVVILDQFADDELAYQWMAAGAFNVWRRPIRPATVATTLARYGRWVLDERERQALKAEVAVLKKRMALMIVGLIGLQGLTTVFGDQLLNWIVSLI